MCKKPKVYIKPGDEISEILKKQNSMTIFGIWTVLASKVVCLDSYEKDVIELMTEDPIAFDIMVSIIKFIDGEPDIEFKALSSRERLIQAASHSGLLSTAPKSNYLVTFNRVAQNKIQVLFLDLRKAKLI